MKQTTKITLCAIIAALSAALMLLSYFPYLTVSVPVAAGMLMILPVVEIDRKWALLTFLVSGVLVFIFAEPESKLLYLSFFGYYPVLKSLIEQIRRPHLEWIIKFCSFNTAMALVFFLSLWVLGIPIEEFELFGKFGLILLFLLANVTFLIYDFAVSRMAALYLARLHGQLQKILRKG
ncbi:MAG: hypothetical protein IJT66_02560 [Clostridia bacterium]|nr:hypothetical protein [Clostridia bacterium]